MRPVDSPSSRSLDSISSLRESFASYTLFNSFWSDFEWEEVFFSWRRLQASSRGSLDLPPTRAISESRRNLREPFRNSSKAWFLYVSNKIGSLGLGFSESSNLTSNVPTKVLPHPGGPWMMESLDSSAWIRDSCWLLSRLLLPMFSARSSMVIMERLPTDDGKMLEALNVLSIKRYSGSPKDSWQWTTSFCKGKLSIWNFWSERRTGRIEWK